MVPAVMAMSELRTDILAATHSHSDHLDPDLLEYVALEKKTLCVGSPDCRAVFRELGVEDDRVTILATGESKTVDGVGFRAVYADHGELAPDAIGLLIDLDGIVVYDTGDTSYCPEKIKASLGEVKVDILIAPINPAYGNLGAENAANLAALIKPRVVIGSHFGMFIEHGGDPGAFLDFAKQTVPETIMPIVMAPGERMIFSVEDGVKEMKTQNDF
jgi:L-ascorbate 6-phosphate lactonase